MTANPKKDIKPAKARRMGSFAIVLVVIAVIVAGGYYLKNRIGAEQADSPEQTIQQRTVVVTTPAAMREFQRSLAVQGNLEARNSAMVSPRIPGILEAIFVDEGDAVTADETKLFQTDAANLKESLEISRHSLRVAQYAKQQAIASLEKTRADLHKAKLDYDRFKRLFEKQAVTADAFEQQESQYLQLQASEKLSATQVDLAAAQEDQAKAALIIAGKYLADTTIYAPVSGKVSVRLLEPGEMGSPGVPVVRIDDISLIETCAYLPASCYSEVIPATTMIEVVVSGKNLGQFPVSYKSPTINPKLRTFEVKCLIDNASASIAPGAMAQIRVILETKQGLSVPSTAIQRRGGKSIVFTVSGDKARMVELQTGIENDGWTEVISDKLNEQSLVVSMGQDMLEDSQVVSVQKGGN
jgi:RND family efflux transporter MFP subunit